MKRNKVVDLLKKDGVAYELSDNIPDLKRTRKHSLPTSLNNIDLYWENKSGPENRWKKYLRFKKELENIE